MKINKDKIKEEAKNLGYFISGAFIIGLIVSLIIAYGEWAYNNKPVLTCVAVDTSIPLDSTNKQAFHDLRKENIGKKVELNFVDNGVEVAKYEEGEVNSPDYRFIKIPDGRYVLYRDKYISYFKINRFVGYVKDATLELCDVDSTRNVIFSFKRD